MGDLWSARFFSLATWWVGYFFTAVQEFVSITFVMHAIFFFRQALAGIFFFKITQPLPQELNGRPLRHNILFHARHIPGLINSRADYISRSQVAKFNALSPEADQLPTPSSGCE